MHHWESAATAPLLPFSGEERQTNKKTYVSVLLLGTGVEIVIATRLKSFRYLVLSRFSPSYPQYLCLDSTMMRRWLSSTLAAVTLPHWYFARQLD
jgi:hypothetical protein